MAKQKSKDLKQNKQSKPFQITQENKYVVFGLLGIFLVLVFLASSYKVSGDDDLFWHLATGRYIVENKVVPDKDVFGHVTQGMEWIPFEWGWDILSYGLYNIGGYNAILIFRSLAFCFIFFLYFMLFRKFKINSFISIAMLFVLLIAIMDRLSPRPHIITYIFFVTVLYILLNYKYIDREKYAGKLYYLPVIFLIWSNTHMGVLAGGLILFIFTLSETIIFLKPKTFSSAEMKPLSQAELKKLWIISIICAVTLLINPHGFQTYVYAYSHTKMKMLETVNEWHSPFTKNMDFGFIVTLYKIFLFSGILVLFYAYIKKDIFFALMAIGFAVYSVRAIRFTVDYEIIMTFFITAGLAYFLSRIKNTGVINFLQGNIPKVVIAIVFTYIISGLPSNKIYTDIQYYRIFGWGINGDFIPVQLFDFMKQNNISGTPYNHFGTGGYLVWNFPGQKNYIDSRNLNDDIFNEYNHIMRMRPRFDKMLEDRGVDYIVYLDPDLIRRPQSLKELVTNYFSTSPDWRLVFWDDKSMLFVKNIPKFEEVINKHGYKIINPYTALFNKPQFDANIKANPLIAREELARKLHDEPKGVLIQSLKLSADKLLQGL